MSADVPTDQDKYVWVEDKVFGFLKVGLPSKDDQDKTKETDLEKKPANLELKGGFLFKKDSAVGRVKSLKDDKSGLEAEFTDGEILGDLPLEQETVITCKLRVNTKDNMTEKTVFFDLNDPCHKILDNVKKVIAEEDFTFVQLFTGDRLLQFECPPPAKIEPKYEVIEEKKPEVEKVEEESKAEGEKTETEQPKPEEQVPVTETIEEKVEPSEPAPPPQAETTIEEKQQIVPEELKEETQPEGEKIEEEESKPPEEAKKVDEKPKSTFKFKEPIRDGEDCLVLDRYAKIGEYDLKYFLELECYIENNEGYQYAQCFDHILVAEDTPRKDFLTLVSISTPLIFRGVGIVGPAPSIVGKPILDFTLLVNNVSSGQHSCVRVKKEGSSEKCHFYYLEPPLACKSLDQIEISVDCSDGVSQRGRFLSVLKDEPVFFGLEGTKFGIDYQKNTMIAAVAYSLTPDLT